MAAELRCHERYVTEKTVITEAERQRRYDNWIEINQYQAGCHAKWMK